MNSNKHHRVSSNSFAMTAVATVVAAMCSSVYAQPAAQALPSGAQVVSGSATFSTSGAAMQIQQNSAKLITNWQNFDIGSAAKVEFVQPSASAVALNRVTGAAAASQIFGVLKSNGRIFLVNPNGILFGASARVDTGALVASTLDIKDNDFLAGKYQFDLNNPVGQVKNFGELVSKQGGFVALLGAEVDNAGRVVATGGQAALAAGQTVRLQIGETGLLGMDVVAGQANAQVNNSGTVIAQGGNVLMSAQSAADMLSGAVNLSGLVQASRIDGQGGQVRLDGNDIKVTSTGRIEATGQGTDVTLWSERATRMDGTITAQGGTVDTSSKGELGVNGQVNAQNWVLDPQTLRVVNTVPANNDINTEYFVAASSIQNFLNGGGNPGNINQGTDVVVGFNSNSSPRTLSLLATQQVSIDADISKTAGGAATLIMGTQGGGTGASVTVNSPISSIAGPLNVQFGASAADAGGQARLNAPLATNGGTVTFYKEAVLAHATPISTKITENSSAQSGSIVFEKNAVLAAPGYSVSLDAQGPQSGGSYTGQGGNIQFKGDILSGQPANVPQYAQALTLDTTGYNSVNAQNGPGNIILGTNANNVVGGDNRTPGQVNAIKSLTLLGDTVVELNADTVNIVSSNGDVITASSRLGTPTIQLNAADTVINVNGDPNGNLAGNVAGYTDYVQSTFNIEGGLTASQSLMINSDRAIKMVDRDIKAKTGANAQGLQVTFNPNQANGSGVGGVAMNNASVTTGGKAFTVLNAEGNGNDVQLLTDGFYAYNSQITTAGGALSITAQAPTDTAAGAGIRLVGAETVLSSGAGDMTLRGSASNFAASGNKDGVIIGEGGNARVTLQTTSGNVFVKGDVSGVGSGANVTGGSRYDGVIVSSKALILTGSGDITIEGAGGGGDKVFIAENHGVRMADADTSVLSTSGNIAIVGASGGKTKGTSGANSFGIFAEGANMYIGSGADAYETAGANIGQLKAAGPTATGHVTFAADSMQFVNTSASHLKVATKAPVDNNGGEIRIHTLNAGTAIEIGTTTGEVANAQNAATQYLGSNWFNGSTNAVFQPGARDVVIGNAKATVDNANGEVGTVGSTSRLTVSAATTVRDNLVLDMHGVGGNVLINAPLTVSRSDVLPANLAAGKPNTDGRSLTINTAAGAQADSQMLVVDNLQLLGAGTQAFYYAPGHHVNTLATNLTQGNLSFNNNSDLSVGSVSVFGGNQIEPSAHNTKNTWLDTRAQGAQGPSAIVGGVSTRVPTVGLQTPNTVVLNSMNGSLAQTRAAGIRADQLSAEAKTYVDFFEAAGTTTPQYVQNHVNTLAGRAKDGDFGWKDQAGFSVGWVNGLEGVVAEGGTGKTIDLQALGGDIAQTGRLQANALRARATGSVLLNGTTTEGLSSHNNVATVAGQAGVNFAYTDADNLQVGKTGVTATPFASAGSQTAGVAAGNTIDLRSVNGSLSQTVEGALSSVNLHAAAATGVVFDTANNAVSTLAGSTTANDFVYKDANGLQVGTVATVAGVRAAAGRVSLESTAGALSQTTDGVITSPSLRAVAATGVSLAQAINNVQNLAGETASGGFAFQNAGGFTVGTAEANGTTLLHSEGIAAHGTTVDLKAYSGDIRQTAEGGITGSALRAVASTGSVLLSTAADNDVTTIAGAAGSATGSDFVFRDALGRLEVGSVGASTGLSAGGTVDLNAVGGLVSQTAAGAATLTQTQAVVANALRARARDEVTLDNSSNNVRQLAGASATGNFRYVGTGEDTTVATVTTVAGTSEGISANTAGASIDLQVTGALKQQAGAPVSATNARLHAASVELKERNNAVSVLAGRATVNGGAFAFYGTPDLTVGTVASLNGVTAEGKVDVQSRGDLTLRKPVSGKAEGSQTDDEAVVLRAEKRFYNETGLSQNAIDARDGRWLVYDNNPLLLNKDMNGLATDRQFLLINTRYQDYQPQDVYAKGNGYITTAQALEPADVVRATSGHQSVAMGNQSRQFSVGDLTRLSELNQQLGATAPVETGAYGSVAVLSSGAAVPLRVAVPMGRAFKLDLSDVVGKGSVSSIAAADGSATPWVSSTGAQLIGTAPKATELVLSISEPGQAQPRKVRVQLQAL